MSNPDNVNLCSTGRLTPGVVNHSDETLSLLCVTFCSTLFGHCSLKEWRSSQTSLEPYLLSTSLYFSDIQARLMLWQKIENIFAGQNIIWWPLEHLMWLYFQPIHFHTSFKKTYKKLSVFLHFCPFLRGKRLQKTAFFSSSTLKSS